MLQPWNLQSFHINIKFALVFESQILSYKLNPVSCEKISQTFVSNTERITWLIGEEIWYVCWNSSHHLCRLSKFFLCFVHFCFVLFCFNSCHNDCEATIFQMRMRECLYHHHPDFLKFVKSLTEINTSLVMKCDHQRLEDFSKDSPFISWIWGQIQFCSKLPLKDSFHGCY